MTLKYLAYTMDAKKAAELVNILRPEIAIPVHYGSVVGKPACLGTPLFFVLFDSFIFRNWIFLLNSILEKIISYF